MKILNSKNDFVKKLASMSGFTETIKGKHEEYHKISFPRPENSDYRFLVYLYSDGEPQIASERTEANKDEYFWYLPFELQDYKTPEEAQEKCLNIISHLLASETRIIQEKGILFGAFRCEYKSGEEWRSVGGTSYLKLGNFNAPKVNGKQKKYESHAVLPENKT